MGRWERWVALPGGGGGQGDPEKDLDVDAVEFGRLRMEFSDQVPHFLNREVLEAAKVVNEARLRSTSAGSDESQLVADARAFIANYGAGYRIYGGVTCHVQPVDAAFSRRMKRGMK